MKKENKQQKLLKMEKKKKLRNKNKRFFTLI